MLETMEKIPIKATRTNLQKIVRWTNSRYNGAKKDEVISDMLEIIHKGQDGRWMFNAGIFSKPRYGKKYHTYLHTLEIVNGEITLLVKYGKAENQWRKESKLYEII